MLQLRKFATVQDQHQNATQSPKAPQQPMPTRHVSSASRIREEVDILALRLQNYVPGLTLSEFKAPRL